MHFEAEANGMKYEVIVKEGRHNWNVSLKKTEGEWNHYDISKSDYQSLDETISFLFKETSYLVDIRKDSDIELNVYCRGSYRLVKIYNDEALLHESLKAGGGLAGGGALNSGMPGKILKVFVKDGDEVKADQPLLIMEAMKMENEMRATSDCVVKKVHITEGQTVEAGSSLVTFE